MNKSNWIEKIDDYLLGRLNDTETAEFEKELESDEAFRNEFLQQQKAVELIRIASLKQKLSQIHERREVLAPVRKLPAIYKWAVAAALVLAVSVIGVRYYLGTNNFSQELYADIYRPDVGLPSLMGANDQYDLDDAMIDYKLGDYRKALQKFTKLQVANVSPDTVQLYLGLAYLGDKDPARMLEVYKDWQPASVQIRNKKDWYTALGYLLQGKTEAFSRAAKAIADDPSHLYASEAREALAKIPKQQ